MATTWVSLIVRQLRMFPGYFQREAPRRRVVVSEYAPPAPPVAKAPRLPHPAEPVLKQLRVEDDRPLTALIAERDALVEETRQKRLANVQNPGNVTLSAELRALDERKAWLEDQIRRKKAAQLWKLAS